jgi:predicted SprT family Zn-dependent metalloprotease
MRFFIDTNYPDFNLNLKMIGVAKKAFQKFETATKSNKDYKIIIENLRSIPVVLKINKNFKRIAGRMMGVMENKALVGLTIEINPLLVEYGNKTTYDVVSHEVAHCIDYVIRGESKHDNQWKYIHKLMGGTGEKYIDGFSPDVY